MLIQQGGEFLNCFLIFALLEERQTQIDTRRRIVRGGGIFDDDLAICLLRLHVSTKLKDTFCPAHEQVQFGIGYICQSDLRLEFIPFCQSAFHISFSFPCHGNLGQPFKPPLFMNPRNLLKELYGIIPLLQTLIASAYHEEALAIILLQLLGLLYFPALFLPE